MRDIYKTAEQAEIDAKYDIFVNQVLELRQSIPLIQHIKGANEAAIKAIITAFKYGYVMGSRATAKQLQK